MIADIAQLGSDFVISDSTVSLGGTAQQVLPLNAARWGFLLGVGGNGNASWGISAAIQNGAGFPLSSTVPIAAFFFRDYPGLVAGPIYAIASIASPLYVVEIIYRPWMR